MADNYRQMTNNAYFAGGCFWCTEAILKSLRGVSSAVPGYSGGEVENPTYEQVSTGETGHAETVKIEFDPSIISYSDLLTVFFATHDPTTLNRQGNDIGTQYRSEIFYADELQKRDAEEFIKKLNLELDGKIVTRISEFKNFYEAEDYHKNYYEQHKDSPYCQLVIAPKIEKLQSRFKELLKK